ncbi:bi-domain-containing oxidoreductase [Mucilaginibacter ginsenosidivorans]|uniref:Zinc-binding dehydrogenase n=1 Tax=Mucilaginibacter ginsenosidivorans TaxID=398053 RepID=A0A5B8V142_9SPHI|nr:bi-domain-containing oxidoreductase [Mucilaginibacter ginsenosidivorans]QEC65084.1 zinc-binding dehydrogenase [Mucilaginibacter ginsenosidivorans]
MKQIIQSFKTGETILEDIPAPLVSRGSVLIKTTRSLVSLGTERMLVEFGKANLVQKARQQPDKVRQVLDKIKTEGLAPTLEAVFNKLGQPLPLGYCNVGKVVAVGDGVSEFKVGDRVTSNGPHAEFVNVPKNLVAAVPENVTDEEAAFTVIGSIGLQGIRLCAPTLGETIVVFGLGLIGLLTAELLISNGCRVIGIDLDAQKVDIARKKGIIAINPREGEDVVKSVMNHTGDVGADGVLITASAKTDDIISQAAQMSRKRGRIILVGVIGLNINRAEFYEKELTFQVSCSYGPGRYDESYEQSGIDYPLQFVRWTEKRNFQTILQAISAGKLDVKSLITERVLLDNYKDIYDNISNKGSIASILEYPESSDASNTVVLRSAGFDSPGTGIGIIGAGNFTKMTMLPALQKAGAAVISIASAGGVTGTALAKKHNINKSTTDYREILADESVGLVMITTRHNQHASMVKQALAAGKHVFVEKPLALNNEELNEIITSYDGTKSLTVGFNRRFSPHIQKIKQLVGNTQMNIIATMNAGHIPPNVWVHDMNVGGGRIIGEACHFIDLITFLTGSKVKAVMMNSMGTDPHDNTDNATILLKYENGSTGVINYFANGSKEYSKERIEVYTQERTAIMDNYRVTQGYGFKGFSKLKTTLDKGHKEQFKLLAERVKSGGAPLIPFDEIINTTRASFAAIQSLKERAWVIVN